MAENARRAVGGAVSDDLEPLSDLEDEINDGVEMPPTIRRNSGGAYTSYVFISSDQATLLFESKIIFFVYISGLSLSHIFLHISTAPLC